MLQPSWDSGLFAVLFRYRPIVNYPALDSTDELQKSAAYMTETYYLSSSKQTRDGTDPARAPFCFAFDTVKTKTGFFGWLEGEIQVKREDEGDNGR